MMKSFLKSLVLITAFCFALAALFLPNPLRVDHKLLYVAGTLDVMVAPDTFIINGEKVKIWGVAPSQLNTDLAQIEAVAAQMSAEQSDEEHAAAAEAATVAAEALKLKMASLMRSNLHCVKKGDPIKSAAVMTCYTQNMTDFAKCLIGRGVVKPESTLQNAAYSEIHKAALSGKSGPWERCH